MNELVTVTADWFRDTWADVPDDDDPRARLHEYIIDPEPLSDDRYDEGDGD
jgi:hypothetical protein